MSKVTKPGLSPENWVDQYGNYLFNFAYSRVFNEEIAEDLVQETYLSALKSLNSFKGDSTERTWLTAILKNKIVDHFRKAGTSREKNILDQNWQVTGSDSPFLQEGDFAGHWKPGRGPESLDIGIEKNIENKEFLSILAICMSFLPGNWALAFTLKIMEECESDEICKELKISSSNLWVILHRTRLKLRECLEKNWIKQP